MSENYGKIKNGKLILAQEIITRDGSLIINDKTFYVKNGYKKILYSTPPENREGYNLVSYWEDQKNTIVQRWNYDRIGDDYSGKLLVAVRNFAFSIQSLKHEIKENYNANKKLKEELLNDKLLIRFIHEHKKDEISTRQMLYKLNEFHLDLEQFFDWIQIKEKLEKMNCIISKKALYIKNNMFPPMYFKSNLSCLHSYETYSTNSNMTMYNMAFIYLFTLFDELLLKIIRIICMHEKKWLISNEELSAEEILKCDTTDELHIILVEKKVNKLAWQGYSDKLAFFKDRGIKIDTEHTKLFNSVILYLSIKRNVLVHNEGIWNQTAKDLLKETDYYQNIAVGEYVSRTYESFEKASDYIESAISYLYDQVCSKFKFLDKYYFEKENQ